MIWHGHPWPWRGDPITCWRSERYTVGLYQARHAPAILKCCWLWAEGHPDAKKASEIISHQRDEQEVFHQARSTRMTS